MEGNTAARFGLTARQSGGWLLALALSLGLTAPFHGPETPRRQDRTPQLFRGRVDLARVRVTVVDRKTGEPVAGLTKADFVVLEDGVEQTVSTVAYDQVSNPISRAAAPDQPTVGSSRSAADRLFLIVFGNGPIEGPVHPFDGVIRFIREGLSPHDRIAVMAYNRVSPFTADHEQIVHVVERLKARHASIGFGMRNSARRATGGELSPSYQADIDELFQPRTGPGVPPRNVVTMLLGTVEFQRNDDRRRRWDGEVIVRDLLKVFAGIEYLRPMEGTKDLVCLTLGLSMPSLLNEPLGLRLDSREDDARLAARANDAQVAIDIIHTAGAVFGDAFGIMSSKNVTELSGGQFSNLYTADDALARVERSTRYGYLVGYVPRNRTLDGKYRKVEVRVDRPDVTVLYAHGYTALPDLPPLNAREVVTRARLRDAARTDVGQDDIKVEARASVVPGGAAGHMRVEVRIDASKLSLKRTEGGYDGVIDLSILCGDANQNVVGSLNQQMSMHLDEAHYQQAMTSGIPYVAMVPLSAVASLVKVLVYDFDADYLGSAYVKVR